MHTPRWGSAAGRRRTFGRALLVGSGSQMRRAPGVGSVSQSGGRRLAAADRTIAPTAAVLDDLEHHYGPLASRAALKTLPPWTRPRRALRGLSKSLEMSNTQWWCGQLRQCGTARPPDASGNGAPSRQCQDFCGRQLGTNVDPEDPAPAYAESLPQHDAELHESESETA
jgi:hypothetical protein